MSVSVAVLDDYQDVARRYGPWDRIDVDLTVFNERLGGADAVVAALQPFEVVVSMREATPLPRAIIERLPALKLIVTVGMANAAIDVVAAGDRGVLVAGTTATSNVAFETTWALLL